MSEPGHTYDWRDRAPHIASAAHAAGLCLRPKSNAPFGWQLCDGFREVASGSLADLDTWLREQGHG
ncbi:hypothetical protein [Nocardia sp. N2S4-5]|uniref:hypothetical protein n=1 Tax=Nocardia sp. N2S4-5 TaxID=3351565 RepID=UPI0037D5D1E9